MSVQKSLASRTVGVLAALIVILAAAQAVTSAVGAGQQPIKDKWITMKIHSMFVPEDALDGSNIDVDTDAGVVTLSGTVPSEAGRARALTIAKATDGAKSVVDKLQIGPPERELDDVVSDAGKAVADAGKAIGTAGKDAGKEVGKETESAAKTTGRKITDGWIKSKIYGQYLTESALDDSDIDIDVSGGAVTLNGTVKTPAGKTRAVAIAKETSRVKSVKDNLKVG